MSYAEELLIRIRSAYESGGFNKLDADLAQAKRGYTQLQSNSTKSTNTMMAQLRSTAASAKEFGASVIGAFDGIGGAITGVIAGFGLVEMATTAWTGATQAQLNKMLLTKKYGAEMADSLVKNIQEIVAAVPGDDTFMNAFLSGVARVGDIQNVDTLKNVAYVASDYMNASLAAGKMSYEIQQDLTKYILYGNTAELERGSILSAQIDSLKGKATIEERVLAMNEAMKKLGLDGLSQLDSGSNMWEEVKGNIQLILTQFGTELLPYLQAVFTWFLDLNESTDGWAARLVVISGIIIALVPVLGMLAGPFSVGIKLIEGLITALSGLRTASAGAAVGQQTLDKWLTASSGSMGTLNTNAAQGTSRLRAFATSGAGVTLALMAMIAALIAVTYYISQTTSATKAWEAVETQRNKQVEAFKSTEDFLNQKLAEQREIREQLNSTGQNTIQINTDIATTEAAIKSNAEAAADAKERYNRAVSDKSALETLGQSRRDKATSEYTKYAGQVAQEGGQAPGTVMDPDYQAALVKTAEKENKLSSVRLTAAGTMKRIAEGNDTYSQYWKTHGEEFGEYVKQYNEYIDSSAKFTEAMDQGDVGGAIWYSIVASIDQADIGLMEIRASIQSWGTDTGNAIKKPFQDAYLGIIAWWGGIPAWFGGIGSRIGELWQEVLDYFNDPTTIGGGVYDALKKIYCIIAGCSPGILPILATLYQYFVFVFNAMISPVMGVKNTIEGFINYILLGMALLQNDITAKWNMITGVVSVWISSGIIVVTDGINWAIALYNQAKGTISVWIGTGVNVGTSAINKAKDIWDSFVSKVKEGVTGFVNVVFGGAGSPNEVDYLYGQGEYYEPDYTPITTTSAVTTVASVFSSTHKTVIAPVLQVDSIDSQERADYVIHEVTQELSKLNDDKGK